MVSSESPAVFVLVSSRLPGGGWVGGWRGDKHTSNLAREQGGVYSLPSLAAHRSGRVQRADKRRVYKSRGQSQQFFTERASTRAGPAQWETLKATSTSAKELLVKPPPSPKPPFCERFGTQNPLPSHFSYLRYGEIHARTGRQASRWAGHPHEPGEALPRGQRLPKPQGGHPHGGSAVPPGGGLAPAQHDAHAALEEERAAQQGGHRHGARGEREREGEV